MWYGGRCVVKQINILFPCVDDSQRSYTSEVQLQYDEPLYNQVVGRLVMDCIYAPINSIIIHQTPYEKSDWSRAFNQFTISCDMINAISAADIAFIMSSSTSAWLPSPLECSPQKQNGWTLRFSFWGWIMSINWGKIFQKDKDNYCILKFLNDLG